MSIIYKGVVVGVTLGTVSPPTPTPIPWASGTDAEIASALQAAHAGTIDLQRDFGWAVGDTRRISVGQFTALNTTVSAQYVDIAISSFDDYNSAGAVLQFDFVQALTPAVQMNSSNTNSGGYAASSMYTSIIPNLIDALPEWLKNALLTFDVLVSAGGGSSTIITVSGNKLALRSEIEVLGSITYSFSGEGQHISGYYNDSTRKIKAIGIGGGQGNGYWFRSPYKNDSVRFCHEYNAGASYATPSTYTRGLAPFGCL